MIILFKYCADVENCENFRDFNFIYVCVYIYIYIQIDRQIDRQIDKIPYLEKNKPKIVTFG